MFNTLTYCYGVCSLKESMSLFVDDKVKTERELPPFLLGPDFKCQHFQCAQNEYFHVHGAIEFDVGTPSVEDVSEEIKVLVQCSRCNL